MRRAFLQGATLVIIGVVVGLAFNLLRPDWLHVSWSSEAMGKTDRGDIPRVTTEEAWELYLEKHVLFVDARESSIYSCGHIPGAVNVVPSQQWGGLDSLRELSRQRLHIVLYCDDMECPKAFDLARFLKNNGISQVAVYRDGWAGWVEAGYPTEDGGGQ
ncbi:MAG: rhodanese-like domain-containing protein [Desulfomonilia bacterium]